MTDMSTEIFNVNVDKKNKENINMRAVILDFSLKSSRVCANLK